MIVKAIFTYEIVVDIDSSNDSYIDIRALSKDLAAMEIHTRLENGEITSEQFDYKIEGVIYSQNEVIL